MATSRPFAYNPIPPGSEISGTTQFVDLAIGVLDEQYDADYGGVKWWEGPDEDLGYIICQPIPPNTQPTPISGLTASVGFYRTTAFTDSAFLNLCNALPARRNQTKFQTTNEAIVWLTANGYWTNYIAPTPTPTATLNATPTPTPTVTPSQTPGIYYYEVYTIDDNCNTTSSFIGYNSTYVLTFNYFIIDGTKYFVMPWATYDPNAVLLGSFTSSSCIAATPTPTGTSSVPVTPTTTPTPTPTPAGANITLFGKTSSTSGGPYYMWYSVDSGSTFTQFSTVLTTSCVNVGTTPLYPVGTTFIFFMSDSNDPASSGGWPTNATSAGGVCPAITTLCTEGAITTTTSGTLTVWATGNQALPNAC